MRQPGCTLGIDLGTTSAKVIAFDSGGRELASAAEQLALAHPEPGAAEQDPADVYAAVMRALATVTRQASSLGYVVERIGISAAMHSLIPVAADDTPLMHALLWMDQRADEAARALWHSPAGPAVYARTGTPVHAMAPLAKLIWLRERRPDVFARAAKFVSLKEWIWQRWFGAWQVDASLASATGLYNLTTGDWDAEALALAGINADKLSALVPTTFVTRAASGSDLTAAGLPSEVACNIGASDGVLANLGVGAIGHEALVMTIGTSLAVRTGSSTPFTDPATRLFCYVLAADRFIVGGPSNSGGVVLEWLARLVTGNASVPNTTAYATPIVQQPELNQLLAAAEQAHDDDLLCLPYVAGERAPLWDARARGAFVGLNLGHTSAHLMRAAVEGLIFNARWIAEPLLARPNPPQQIIASGRVLDVAWIRQLVAEVFGLPVRFLGDVDASAFGAAALSCIATSTWTWEDIAAGRYVPPGSLTSPATPDRYAQQYARFRQLSASLAPAST
jgi:gluconokinase